MIWSHDRYLISSMVGKDFNSTKKDSTEEFTSKDDIINYTK